MTEKIRRVRSAPLARRPALSRADSASASVAVLGAVLAALTGSRVDLTEATDVGVIGLLPPAFWLGLLMVSGVFVVTITRRSRADWLYALTVVCLIVPVFGLSSFASDIPRGNIAFRHAGIVDNLARTGAADVSIDAYFSWPAFFMLGALFTGAAGLESPLVLTCWAPLLANLMILPVMLLLVRRFTAERETQWLAVWLYFLLQWVGQDYFAPQTYTYLLYLVVITAMLGWFCVDHAAAGPPRSRLVRWQRSIQAWSTPTLLMTDRPYGRRRAWLMVLVSALALVTVPSHQLTPFALVIALGLLAVVHGRTPLIVGAVLVVGIAGWVPFMSSAYLAGNLSGMVADFGDVDAAVGANVAERVAGSDGHTLVVRLRMIVTVVLVALAGVGTWRRWRLGYRDTVPVLLSLGAFLLVPLQPYGGEMLLRSYFFALPFLALLAAFALRPTALLGRGGRRQGLAVLAITAILLPLLFVTRYGNARIEQYAQAEVDAVHRTYEMAGSGAALFAVSSNVPWKYTQYEAHRTHVVRSMWLELPDADQLAQQIDELATDSPAGGYLVTGPSQLAYLEMFGGMPPEAADAVLTLLTDRHGWRVVFEEGSATVLTSCPEVSGCAT